MILQILIQNAFISNVQVNVQISTNYLFLLCVTEENNITMELLKYLDKKLIAELIPEIGPRIIFMRYCKKEFSKETTEASSSFTNVSSINIFTIKL